MGKERGSLGCEERGRMNEKVREKKWADCTIPLFIHN